jgi:hypothetical protein
MALYTVRVFKSLLAQPDVRWANTYEIEYAGEMDYNAAEGISAALIAAEQELHIDVVKFDRCTVSTWLPDSAPYDPAALHTFTPSGDVVGANAIIGDVEVLDTVLWVKRIADNGRNGRLFYRGVLTAADTQEGPKRKPALTSAGTTRAQALLDAFKTVLAETPNPPEFVMAGQSQTGLIYHAAAEGEKQVVEKQYGPVKVRGVRDFVIGGVTRVTTDNAYFDKP